MKKRITAALLITLSLSAANAIAMQKYSSVRWYFSTPNKTIDTVVGYEWFGCVNGSHVLQGIKSAYVQREVLYDCSKLGPGESDALADCFDGRSMEDAKKCSVQMIDEELYQYCQSTDWRPEACAF